MWKKLPAISPRLFTIIFRMNSVGPTTRITSNRRMARTMLKSASFWMPRFRPRRVLAPNNRTHTVRTATLTGMLSCKPVNSASSAETRGTPMPSEVVVPAMMPRTIKTSMTTFQVECPKRGRAAALASPIRRKRARST